MKKTILTIFLISIFNLSYGDIQEYRLFIKGLEQLEANNPNEAKNYLISIIENYPNSNLVKTTRPYFYLGKIHYKLENYKKAINLLKLTNYKKYESNYLIGSSYLKLSNYNLAEEYLNKNYLNFYNYENSEWEKLALEKLSLIKNRYSYIYKLRFDDSLSVIGNLSNEDILMNANYSFSKGRYSLTQSLYENLLNRKRDYEIEIELIKTLYYQKKYTIVIKKGLHLVKDNIYKSKLYYHIGNAYRRKGQLTPAIKYLKKVKIDYLQRTRNYIIGKLYYLKGDYKQAAIYLEAANTTDSIEYLLKLYDKTDNNQKYSDTLNYLYRVNPYSDLAGEYRYKTYLKTGNKSLLDDIIKYNYNSIYYNLILDFTNKRKELEKYNLETKLSKYENIVEKIELLTEIEFFEGIIIELNYTNFSSNDKLIKNYLLSNAYENAKKYDKAIKTSYKNSYSFSKYYEFQNLLYPKYYERLIEKYSRYYDVDKYLIYSIIKQESLFNHKIISYASAYGLMQLILPTARMFEPDVNEEQLLEPETNIKIGIQYIKFLKNKYGNNTNAIIAGYNGGPGNVDKWLKRYGKITIDNIPFKQTKNYLKKVLNNYLRYKNIYR